MLARLFVLGACCLTLVLGVGYVVSAQDPVTPATTPQTTPASDEILCVTPIAEATGSPVMVEIAPTTAASPGAVGVGTPVGFFECGTPAPEI